MDEPYGRVFAVVYLIARPILVAGIVVLNVTDGIAVWVVCILASSAVAMTVLAIILSRRTREERRRPRWYEVDGYSRAWCRLLFAVEAVALGRSFSGALVDSASAISAWKCDSRTALARNLRPAGAL